MYRGEKPIEAGLAPGWTLDKLAEHAVDFWLSTEDLPSPDNRVTPRRRTAASSSATRPTTRCPSSGSTTSSAVDAESTSTCTST